VLLFESTHVSSAVASTQTFTPFPGNPWLLSLSLALHIPLNLDGKCQSGFTVVEEMSLCLPSVSSTGARFSKNLKSNLR